MPSKKMATESTIELEPLDRAGFVALYGGLYEHSPWIAEQAWLQIADRESVTQQNLINLLKSIVDNSSYTQRLELLRAHPELAGKAAIDGCLTPASNVEQASARLDLCSQAEFESFHELNSAYNEKFNFPFILAVRNKKRAEILSVFKSRLDNSLDVEFCNAIEQVHKIASLRLIELSNDG